MPKQDFVSARVADLLQCTFRMKLCVEVFMENAVKFLVKFYCSSFLRK